MQPSFTRNSRDDFLKTYSGGALLFRAGTDKSACRYIHGKGILSTSQSRCPARYKGNHLEPLPSVALKKTRDNWLIQHMDFNNTEPTPFISTSQSILWAIWEMRRRHIRRNQSGGRIFAIELHSVASHAFNAETALSSLQLTGKVQKFVNFARKSREIIVEERIPERAIVATATWDEVKELRPPWLPADGSGFPPKDPWQTQSQFDIWCDEIKFRLNSWRQNAEPREPSAERYATCFAFHILTMGGLSTSELEWGERRAVRRLTLRATIIVQELLFEESSNSRNASEMRVMIEALIRAKWPRPAHSSPRYAVRKLPPLPTVYVLFKMRMIPDQYHLCIDGTHFLFTRDYDRCVYCGKPLKPTSERKSMDCLVQFPDFNVLHAPANRKVFQRRNPTTPSLSNVSCKFTGLRI